jgi:DNA-binding transcriptional MerR regulator
VLTIGELAERTGVPTSALRYYDELGLVPPAARRSGQRRYHEDAVRLVGLVLLLRDVGFTLGEVGRLVGGAEWRVLVTQKIAELDRLIADTEAARTALQHSLECPAGGPAGCPKFWSIVDERLPQ